MSPQSLALPVPLPSPLLDAHRNVLCPPVNRNALKLYSFSPSLLRSDSQLSQHTLSCTATESHPRLRTSHTRLTNPVQAAHRPSVFPPYGFIPSETPSPPQAVPHPALWRLTSAISRAHPRLSTNTNRTKPSPSIRGGSERSQRSCSASMYPREPEPLRLEKPPQAPRPKRSPQPAVPPSAPHLRTVPAPLPPPAQPRGPHTHAPLRPRGSFPKQPAQAEGPGGPGAVPRAPTRLGAEPRLRSSGPSSSIAPRRPRSGSAGTAPQRRGAFGGSGGARAVRARRP